MSLAANVMINWSLALSVDDVKEYCFSSETNDPECSQYSENQEPDITEEIAGLSLALDLFQIIEIFVISFISCIAFGTWNHYYPIKKTIKDINGNLVYVGDSVEVLKLPNVAFTQQQQADVQTMVGSIFVVESIKNGHIAITKWWGKDQKSHTLFLFSDEFKQA